MLTGEVLLTLIAEELPRVLSILLLILLRLEILALLPVPVDQPALAAPGALDHHHRLIEHPRGLAQLAEALEQVPLSADLPLLVQCLGPGHVGDGDFLVLGDGPIGDYLEQPAVVDLRAGGLAVVVDVVGRPVQA